MEQIRSTLKILFVDTAISNGVSDVIDNKNRIPSKEYSNYLYATYDQQEVIANVASTLWASSNDVIPSLVFCPQKSVFNILLHATCPILDIVNGNPICHFSHLFRWHSLSVDFGEDIFVTSYLSSRDLANGIERDQFAWKPYIDHDCSFINCLMDSSMVELHAHLKGSSLSFDLSWIYMMNHTDNLKRKITECGADYKSIIKAIAIRCYLYQQLQGYPSNLDINEIIQTDDDLLLSTYENQLFTELATVRKDNLIDYSMNYTDEGIYEVLCGERRLLYRVFRAIYSGEYCSNGLSRLFYIYLIAKEQFRSRIIQTNSQVGFANFANYQEKNNIIFEKDKIYDRLLYRLAIGGYDCNNPQNRYFEGRITPKDSVKKNVETLKQIRNVLNEEWQYGLVYHFIKRLDKPLSNENLLCRHYHLRNQIRKQAQAIIELRRNNPKEGNKVVGIDAANSEIYCRPEVFAQAFRYIRQQNAVVSNDVLTDVGFTYHAGEDNYDLVDGLRAIEELLIYMNYKIGDRIGHGLALGTDVKSYYRNRDNAIFATNQVILDNIAWLYVTSLNIVSYSPVHSYLESIFRIYYLKVYGQSDDIKIRDYYASWLLRGNNPERMVNNDDFSIDPWQQCDYNTDKRVIDALHNHKATHLFYRYHYDNDVRERGAQGAILKIETQIRDSLYECISKVQEHLLSYIEHEQICIECNPSSNYKIGEMTRYDMHPIFRFNNDGIKTLHPKHSIRVSINTDDSGVFGTSQEREYSLLALALQKSEGCCQNTPVQTYDWLESIRKMSLSQKFKQYKP